jgi:hypothetical protein
MKRWLSAYLAQMPIRIADHAINRIEALLSWNGGLS